MMKGREIKNSGLTGYTKGTKMFRTRYYIVAGGLVYCTLMTLAFYQMDTSHKVANEIKIFDDSLRLSREEKFQEILAKRVARAEKLNAADAKKSV